MHYSIMAVTGGGADARNIAADRRGGIIRCGAVCRRACVRASCPSPWRSGNAPRHAHAVRSGRPPALPVRTQRPAPGAKGQLAGAQHPAGRRKGRLFGNCPAGRVKAKRLRLKQPKPLFVINHRSA